MDRVDITTGTLGKALGGASGGYTSARAEVVALLRQRSALSVFQYGRAAGRLDQQEQASRVSHLVGFVLWLGITDFNITKRHISGPFQHLAPKAGPTELTVWPQAPKWPPIRVGCSETF